ncbi:MAG: AAA family ATPase [Tepidisphaeraceae bacterium]|jgi:capsular exopolysaccharide synthesis family protein
MTSEMQLAQAAGLAPLMQNHHLELAGPPQQAKPTGLKKIHRLLRGRYPMVITLGIICAVGGMFGGYYLRPPEYSSTGELLISDLIPDPLRSSDEPRPGFNTFLQSQIAIIQSREMCERAMDKPEWRAVDSIKTDDEIDHYFKNLTADIEPATSIIEILYTDPDPRVAQAGAIAMFEAYQDSYEAMDPMGIQRKLRQLEDNRDRLDRDLQGKKQALEDLSKEYGTNDLSTMINDAQMRLANMDERIDEDKLRVQVALGLQQAAAQDAANLKKGTTTVNPMTSQQIAEMGDTNMRNYMFQRDAVATQIQRNQAVGLGDQLPAMKDLENDEAMWDNKIKQYTDEYNKEYELTGNSKPGAGPVAVNIQEELVNANLELNEVTQERDKLEQEIRDLGTQQESLKETANSIADTQTALQRVQDAHDQLDASQTLMQSQLTIIHTPSVEGSPSSDPRKKLAAVGFVFGGALPACVVILFGLLDGRFRFSDETHTDLGGVPLLGILPNLPDLLTDPQQAATAAHCVHQIRTILQITGQSLDRRVFTVTSSSSGDGKTSLTLALGLSFAASGSRTLLIDGDLVGGGLTARLNVKVDHGVLEAMATRDILQYIRGTDVADLSILPIGQALGGYTGTIAPAAVRRLVDEARKHFDIVIIDTGPILGSIEASPVAVAADGVILCVSRGQQRQLVDRALAHLHSIGAKLAGVVFNRAQGQDFSRSMSRMSMKPLPSSAANGRNGADRIGPVAKAVASSVRSGTGNGNHA